MSDYVIGLTGGIGSGKSTVADAFVALGAPLVDTDAIAHELTGPGGLAIPAIEAAFGREVLGADGALNRPVMRRIVFADPLARQQLEAIIHPLIRNVAHQRAGQANFPFVLLAVPLLVESAAYTTLCDRILVVDCSEDTQIERVKQRNGLPEAEIRGILAAQASRAQRLAVADDVIDNNGGVHALNMPVKALFDKYLRLASEKIPAKS